MINQPNERIYRLEESPLHLEIKDSMVETLGRASQRNVPLFLTGGISASLLSHEQWPTEVRPLSKDLDFLVAGDDATRAALEAEFDSKFKLNTGKAIFKSDKLQSHATNGVELDFIASSNIVHEDASLAVTLSPLALAHAQKEAFLGVEVSTLPAELIAIQKLFAGRGADLGKFDLLDAESMIRSGCISPDMFRLFLHDLTTEGTHRLAVAARLTKSIGRLSSNLDTKTLLEAINDSGSSANVTTTSESVRNEIAELDV